MPSFASFEMEDGVGRRFVNDSSAVLELGAHPYRLLDTWIILYSIGQVLLLLLLVTMLFVKRQRPRKRPTLINLIIASLLGTIPPCILYYAGQQANPTPPAGLCLVQAILKHGSGVMIIVALFALVLDILLLTRASIRLCLNHKVYTWSMIALLTSPYVALIAWSIPVIFLGLRDPIQVYRIEESFYCTLHGDIYGNLNTLFGVTVVFGTIGCECYTIIILCRSWRAVHKMKDSRDFEISLIVRAGLLTTFEVFFIFVTIIATVYNSRNMTANDVSTVFEALVPTCIFVAFGLHPEFVRSLIFWRAAHSGTDKSNSISDLDCGKRRVRPEDTMQSDFTIP